MKLTLTEEFLWDIYNSLKETGDIAVFLFDPRPKKWGRLSKNQNPIFEKYRRNKSKKAFSNFISRLKRNGLIKSENLKGKNGFMLTKEGLTKALKASFIMDGKPKRKDRKWIMLIFDVPEKNRKSRDLLRSILHNLGYKLLQQSVWMTPYDVFNTTEKLLQMYSLDKYVKIFLIEEI